MRRVLVRMQTMGVKGFATYLDFLQVDPEEFTRLFNTILINVTSFFRDPPNWDVLRDSVIPRLAGATGNGDPIRVWSAGCASGGGASPTGLWRAEGIGRGASGARGKISAREGEGEALTQARHAVYGPRTAEDAPAPLLEKYFDRQDDR